MRTFLVLVAVRQACGECWGADVSSFTWCSDYADAGFSCNGDMCAVESCKPWLTWMASCSACAVHYPDATLHTASGRCCDRLSEDGSCEGPQDGLTDQTCDGLKPDSPWTDLKSCALYGCIKKGERDSGGFYDCEECCDGCTLAMGNFNVGCVESLCSENSCNSVSGTWTCCQVDENRHECCGSDADHHKPFCIPGYGCSASATTTPAPPLYKCLDNQCHPASSGVSLDACSTICGSAVANSTTVV